MQTNNSKEKVRQLHNAVERRMSESRVRENLTHGLMRGKRVDPSNLLYFVSTKTVLCRTILDFF